MSEIKLTDHQQQVFDQLWTFIDSPSCDGYLALLSGYAGVGKSLMTIQLIKKVLKDALFNNIAVCATTNKALKVIKKMLPPEERNNVTFKTIHSLLGLKHKITAGGKEVFERDKNEQSKFGIYDVVIVDESSMVSDELFQEILEQNYRGTKVIFVGDSHQINPVGHEHAIPMLEEKRAEYNIKHFQLTEIVRQSKGNPIIETSQEILNNKFIFEVGKKLVTDGKGYAMLNKHQPQVINKLLYHYFCSDDFEQDADHCKVVCWRNIVVDNFNNLIRGMKYGLNAPKLVVGEKLIVDKPIKGLTDDEILFNTNEDLVVLALDVKTKTVNQQDYVVYSTTVRSEEEEHTFDVLHEKSLAKYNMTLKVLSEDAKNEKLGFERQKKWKKFFAFQDKFGQVKYNYAITGHCSQGSTYKNTFVVYTDIMLNRNLEEQKRILYTASTRSKEMLYFM